MSLSILVAGLAALASALPVAEVAAPVQERGCPGIAIFAARGSYQDPGVGSLAGVIDLMTTYAHDTSVEAVDYPAIMGPGYGASVGAGVADLQGKIAAMLNACPDTKVALLGYSQGANVVGDALCGSGPLAPQYADNIKSVVLFGDPTHAASQTFSVGTGRALNGMIPRPVDTDCAPYSDRIISYCNAGDPVCANGPDGRAHETYFDEYNVNAAYMSLLKLWA